MQQRCISEEGELCVRVRQDLRVLMCMSCASHVYVYSMQGEGGELYLEGVVSDDYYRVRQLLYDQFAII